MKVLLTVPHAACLPNSPRRMCDKRAFEAAIILRNALLSHQKKGLIKEVTVYANKTVPRSIIDMNRSVSRGTLWRMQLSELLQRQPSFDWVVDVHSFPDQHAWGQKKHLAFEFLYDLPHFPHWFRRLLLDQFAPEKFRTGRIGVDLGKNNDIMDEVLSRSQTRNPSTKVFLLEVNEDEQVFPLEEMREKLQDLVSFIVKTIKVQ